MPKGPRGEKRPGDVIGAAIKVARIAVGEEVDDPKRAQQRQAGKAGAKARASSLTPEEREDIARVAATARWRKKES